MDYVSLGIVGTILFAVIVLFVIVAVLVLTRNRPSGFHGWTITPEQKLAGMHGEKIAARAIGSVLRDDDSLFTNVSIEYDGKPAELDNVIVNKYGVFIIEVKNYTGYIVGNEDDYEWQKYKTTDAGNIYEKTVKNPITQVKRQIYILAKFLNYYGISVWVRGYALLLHGNSPVDSKYILSDLADIDRKIHTADRRMLDSKTVDSIKGLLGQYGLLQQYHL